MAAFRAVPLHIPGARMLAEWIVSTVRYEVQEVLDVYSVVRTFPSATREDAQTGMVYSGRVC